jgi:integrase
MRLTDTLLRNAKPASKPRHFSDGMGLSLVIQTDGKRYWRFRYRLNGQAGLKSIGVYPRVSLKEARQLRDAFRRDVAQGRKPGSQPRKGTDDDTFGVIAEKWFQVKLPTWSQGSSEVNRMRLDRYILPALGAKHISTVRGPDLMAMLKPIQQDGKHETASRVLTIVKQCFDFGIAEGRCTTNPAPACRTLLTKTTPRHMAAVTEPAEISWLLKKLYAYDESLIVGSALRLAPLFFVRPGELRKAEWSEFRLDGTNPQWEFVASKTGTPHVVPLARQAVEILAKLKADTGYQEFVFPGQRRNGRCMSENTLSVAMRTIGIPKEKMSVHGFRALSRTALDEQLHQRVELIEHQLAHKVRDAQGRAYNRTQFLTARRAMMQLWADYLDNLRTT